MEEVKSNFLGIPNVELNDAQVIILPVPFEATTSYGHGTKNGPKAIIDASHQVELYDPKIGDEIQNLVKIATVPAAVGDRGELQKASAKYADKFLICLGGEHSITPELVKPFVTRYKDLSVLQIDAHTDMRDEWEGNKYSHACAMRRVQEQGIDKIIQVGIRNTSKEEQKYLKENYIFWGNKFDTDEILKKLSDNVYLTFDVDGLDVSIMPATGTPEPGGLSYEQALGIMRALAKEKNIVAADFVELAPISGLPAYNFVVAKLIYQLILYKSLHGNKSQ